jgi:heterodisulfide reductase subunit A
MKHDAVMVIGAGIPGIQAATDLANMGFTVYLIEKSPSIGGAMAQLDKTFPTNDCAICILAPKMIECYQHPNVKTFTYSEVIDCTGSVGKFKVQVKKLPRYVDIEKCTGCGECFEKCPSKVPSEFDMALGKRKAIYMPFMQAVPLVATIDAEHCLKILKDKCGNCQKVCKAEAIDFNQKEEVIELNVGAIIVSTGFDFYDISQISEYGYASNENVITAIELERMLSASGPTLGHIQRPSDGESPRRLAFIQCTGSRDLRHVPYCSSVCCMHSTKEAILANEHNPDLKSYIFYIDIRAAGKGFQDYVHRAEKDYNVTFIKGKVGSIAQNKENKNPILQYEDTKKGEIKTIETDLVVLASALIPSSSIFSLSKTLGFKIDEHGFAVKPDIFISPVDTTIPGIFACGFIREPQDIPESVTQASGAAARVAEVLSEGGE